MCRRSHSRRMAGMRQGVMQMGSAGIGRGTIAGHADRAAAKEGIRKYLDVAARFPQMPWYNILLILEQMPEAEILCGIRAWKEYGAVLRQGEKPVMLLSPAAVRHGDTGSGIPGGSGSGISGNKICADGTDSRASGSGEADGNGMGEELGMGTVGVYDIAQVKLAVDTPALKMPGLDAGLEDVLRGRCGLAIMEDREGGFLRSRAIKSCVSREERTVYIRPGLPDKVRDAELMKCYAKYMAGRTVWGAENQGNAGGREERGWLDAGNQGDKTGQEDMAPRGDAGSAEDLAVHGMIGEYRDMAGDCLAYLLCKYFSLPEYPLRVVPSGLFGEMAERKGRFLCGLSALAFGAVKELTGRKMLGFNETMFCNLFFTEPDRGRILENLGRFMGAGKTAAGMAAPDLLAFQRDISREEKFSDGEIKAIYEKRLARKLFSFPPVIYGE